MSVSNSNQNNSYQDSTNTAVSLKVSANGILANIFLAFFTTAGIFYINIMPAVVSGLIEGLGFSNQQAGFVSSANLYGASFGALLAVFIIKRINWRKWGFALLVGLVIIDVASMYASSASLMIAIRACHGLVGGLLVGIGFCIIARTANPDKAFGYLLFVQWGLGGLGLMLLPGLVPKYGTDILFMALIAFSIATFVMALFLPDYPIVESPLKKATTDKTNKKLLAFTLVAIFLFQGANMGLFAYMIALGKAEGLSTSFMSNALGLASWIALLGAFLVIVIDKKYGRTIPLIIGIIVTAFCSWLLHFSVSENVYLYSNIVIGVGWAFVLPYMFGICSELDTAGQYAALGGFASKMGLASGPMIAALLLNGEDYSSVINIAAIGLVLCLISVLNSSRKLDVQGSQINKHE